MTPFEALERHRAGEWPLIVPTVWHLELLSGWSGPDEAMAKARSFPARRFEPHLVQDGQGRWRAMLADVRLARGDVAPPVEPRR